MKPIYSVRDSLGRELWWTTSRKKALDLAADITEPGNYITHDGRGATTRTANGLRAYELPISVYRCSVVMKVKPAKCPFRSSPAFGKPLLPCMLENGHDGPHVFAEKAKP